MSRDPEPFVRAVDEGKGVIRELADAIRPPAPRVLGYLHDLRCKGPKACKCRRVIPVVES